MTAKRIATAIEAAPADSFQQAVSGIMDGEKAWQAASAAEREAIAAHRRAQIQKLFEDADGVDLVGHSTPIKGYLKLGDWILDPEEAQRFASYLPENVKSVRLIGCATARTAEGRAAIEAFARGGVSAYGTINKVYTRHFDKTGVKPGGGGPPLTRILPGQAPTAALAVRPPPSSKIAVYNPSGSISPETRALLRRLTAPLVRPVTGFFATLRWTVRLPLAMKRFPRRWILRLLSPFATSMPGLLTEPLLAYEISSGRKQWRLEILYDFEYARFYPVGAPLAKRDRVYKIRGFGHVAKTLLETYLELQPSGIKLVSRHAEAGDRGGTL
jgi:hypothetical protein